MARNNLAWTGVIVGILAISLATLGAKSDSDLYSRYEEFARVIQTVRDKYVDPKAVDVDKLFKGAIEGMLATLPDPYDAYYTGDDLANFRVDTEGQFGGLGIEITSQDGVLTVLTPLVGTPAFQAGVEAGDKIIKIDGESTEGLTLNEAVRKLRGKPGDPVTITVLRKGASKPIDIRIVRAIIVVPSLRGAHMIDPKAKIGYIWITSFQENTAADLRKAVKKLVDEGMQELVLDLRYNPGGLLNVAIEVAELFLDKDMVIVKTKGRRASDTRVYRARGSKIPEVAKMPIAILVNQSSASASEIVAGALRDHHRAILVGDHTYGKGSVQTVIPMNNNKAVLKLTTARYYTPSDTPILPKKGIEPDIKVVLTTEQVKRMSEFRRQEHLRENKQDAAAAAAAGGEGKAAEKLTWENSDPQLVRAVDALRVGRIFYERLLAGQK